VPNTEFEGGEDGHGHGDWTFSVKQAQPSHINIVFTGSSANRAFRTVNGHAIWLILFRPIGYYTITPSSYFIARQMIELYILWLSLRERLAFVLTPFTCTVLYRPRITVLLHLSF
jgi:hypothetical protein